MKELFEFFSNTQTKEHTSEVHTQKMYNKRELKQAFEQMYLETFRTRETAKTYKGDNINIILGTSKGFIDRLKDAIECLDDESEKPTTPTNFKDRIYYMFYMTEPKNLIDILWIGHMLGSKSMADWKDGKWNFNTPEGYND
jgi:hypothetical protein